MSGLWLRERSRLGFGIVRVLFLLGDCILDALRRCEMVVIEVDERDHDRCTFVGEDGRVCGTRFLLQYHHEAEPYALGGAATAANLTLHCKAHNDLKARRVFGDAHMDRFTRREKPKTLEPPLPEPFE
jgi:hypothetical protein